MEDWAEIRRLHRAEGLGIKTIARRLGVARNTVRAVLGSDAPPRYERMGQGSIVDGVEPEIRELLGEFPKMPATVIAERIGWKRGMTVLRDRIAELRPLFVPPDPSQRTWYRPGELAQFDLWQPDVVIPVGFGQTAKLWTVVGVSGYSRLIGAVMVPSRAAHDVLGGMWYVIGEFGAVPRKAVWDQEGCIGQIRGGRQVLTTECLPARSARPERPRQTSAGSGYDVSAVDGQVLGLRKCRAGLAIARATSSSPLQVTSM